MIPKFNKVHNHFQLNGYHYSHKSLVEVAYSYIKEGEPFEVAIGEFLLSWLDDNEKIEVTTSGSTGKPKTIWVAKQAMVHSAISTGNFFNLKPKNRALLCLPAETIAGKMMLVRAIILGWHLDSIQPKKKLTIHTNKAYNFSAMIPLQLENNLQKINTISTIIVGGAPVSEVLKKRLKTVQTAVYETYGMTETVSHVAIKKLNKFKSNSVTNNFQVLPDVSISTDTRDCLIIKAAYISNEPIVTNDVVKIHDHKTFEWLGRFDHVINSGSVKIYPEIVEKKLQKHIDARFFIASEPDTELGEKVVLVIESEEKPLSKNIFKALNKFEVPKDIYFIKRFTETNSGKIKRKKTLSRIHF